MGNTRPTAEDLSAKIAVRRAEAAAYTAAAQTPGLPPEEIARFSKRAADANGVADRMAGTVARETDPVARAAAAGAHGATLGSLCGEGWRVRERADKGRAEAYSPVSRARVRLAGAGGYLRVVVQVERCDVRAVMAALALPAPQGVAAPA